MVEAKEIDALDKMMGGREWRSEEGREEIEMKHNFYMRTAQLCKEAYVRKGGSGFHIIRTYQFVFVQERFYFHFGNVQRNGTKAHKNYP